MLMVSDFGLQKLVNERSGSTSDLNKVYESKYMVALLTLTTLL